VTVFTDDDDGGGFQMTLTEEAARRLVADLTFVLDNPDHRGVMYHSPLD
jgi:hypothetical protein